MELWIRSQSKLSLIKINDVCIDYNNQKNIIANFRNLGNGDDDYFPLGEYDTEERALEVLNEIMLRIHQLNMFELGVIRVCDGFTTIYEMPER